MELNGNLNLGLAYQQFFDKTKELDVDKTAKLTFESGNLVDVSNDTNAQKNEELNKIEKMVSSSPSLENANEELLKNNNLNKLFLQTLM